MSAATDRKLAGSAATFHATVGNEIAAAILMGVDPRDVVLSLAHALAGASVFLAKMDSGETLRAFRESLDDAVRHAHELKESEGTK